ncbi:MAG: DegT/DnrJ/EryC1/StrS family aminotransferase [Verrucomicrobiae bacterium]|nr:DegT/DnrJ/EryC1/StrS family aminotransferase [Verrucomicrobiae bacterium]
MKRIFLSPPHLSGEELSLLGEVLAGNWITSMGPELDRFEAEFCRALRIGEGRAVAVNSGTAAIHLSLILAGVRRDDEVVCSTFTFVGSANPILYQAAKPIFIDSDERTWNLSPALLEEFLEKRAKTGRMPKALVLAHLYGQAADVDPVRASCARHGVLLIEDAAEALGAKYHGRAVGLDGEFGIFSFNGNKIITTSGGGMLVTRSEDQAALARKLSTQAKDPGPHYQHSIPGYNYRFSNVLAAIGLAQLKVLEPRVAARRAIFDRYRRELGDLPGVSFMPEPEGFHSTRWLTCVQIEPAEAGTDREKIRLHLENRGIESRPLWKPMHLQPLFEGCERIGGEVSAKLFEKGLCLPSGSSLTPADQERVIAAVRECFR